MYRDIGPAVWNGGFSTLLAIVPLATSQSHVFITFFRVRIINDNFLFIKTNIFEIFQSFCQHCHSITKDFQKGNFQQ